MGLKTREEYIESLKGQKPEVYMLGERVEDVTSHPLFRGGINAVAATYDAAQGDELKSLAVSVSDVVDQEVNTLVHLPRNAEDIIRRVKLMRELTQRHVCIMRCLTGDALNALWASTFDCDKKHGTNYHQRFQDYTKHVQSDDLTVSTAMTDVKGDRSLRPGQQKDGDLYLHIVEKKEDGIIVRGAKANITGAPYSHEMIVLPTRDIREEEADYAVAFAVPVETKGIRYISRPPDISSEEREIERPIRRKYGHVENLVIFDDVFVPYDRVFLCGEWDMAASAVLGFANIHRGNSKCGCKAGQVDMMIGAAALIADYNGLAKAPIIRDKLAEMIMTAEIGYSCGVAAAVDGQMHPSGEYMINYLQANVGKYLASAEIGEDYKLLQDIGGGLVVTMPTEKDFRHPRLGEDMDKYLKGRDGVPTENRIKAFKLVEDLTASAFGGWLMGISLNGAGSPMAEKIEAMRNYDLKKRLGIVKDIAGIRD